MSGCDRRKESGRQAIYCLVKNVTCQHPCRLHWEKQWLDDLALDRIDIDVTRGDRRTVVAAVVGLTIVIGAIFGVALYDSYTGTQSEQGQIDGLWIALGVILFLVWSMGAVGWGHLTERIRDIRGLYR